MKPKIIFLFISISFFLISCGSSKRSHTRSETKTNYSETTKSTNKKAEKIVDYATKYVGVRYRYGGTTKRGMDCSGLVHISFLSENIPLPRTSRAMSLEGNRLNLREVEKGDLLFFQTDKDRNVINHVGLVVETSRSDIRFIHSTSSRGVIISSLEQAYWKDAFMMARRVL